MPALGASQEFFQIAEDESIVQRRTEKSEWQQGILQLLAIHKV